MRIKHLIAAGTLISATSGLSWAEDEGPAFSYSHPNAHTVVETTVDTLVTWANGEYAEHDFEGLFQRHPQEGAIIRATVQLAEQLKRDAAGATDSAQAKALLYAAEATARYAAHMPHMLEDRSANASQR